MFKTVHRLIVVGFATLANAEYLAAQYPAQYPPWDALEVRVPIHFDHTQRAPEKIIRDQGRWLSFWMKMGTCNFNLEIKTQEECQNPKIKSGSNLEIVRMIQTRNQNQYELQIDPKRIECSKPIPLQFANAYLICSPRKTELQVQNETDPHLVWSGRNPVASKSNGLIDQIKEQFTRALQ